MSTAMPGDYEIDEVQLMGPTEFAAAKAAGWKKPATHINLPSAAPSPAPAVEARDDVWASNASDAGQEFTCPSGQTCLLRPVSIEALLAGGILDQITRLEGLAQVLVDNASGAPPAQRKLPTTEELQTLLDVLQVLIPIAVAQPHVHSDSDEKVQHGSIPVSAIDLEDRMAIMDHVLGGIKKLDGFRNA